MFLLLLSSVVSALNRSQQVSVRELEIKQHFSEQLKNHEHELDAVRNLDARNVFPVHCGSAREDLICVTHAAWDLFPYLMGSKFDTVPDGRRTRLLVT